MSGQAASRALCGALAALAALTSTGAAAQSVRISGLSDVQFGTLTNLINDQRASQTICVYSSALNGGYRVTATGSGPSGAFTLQSGSAQLEYELQWASSANQTSGQPLSPGVPLASQTGSTWFSNCLFGLFLSASLITVLRAQDTSSARAGAYSGSVALMIAPN